MKKVIIPLLIAVMIFGSTITTHAAVTADYANATYYLELPDGKRFLSEYALNWGKSPIYIKVEDDAMIMFCQKGLYLAQKNGNYDIFGGCEKFTYTFDGSNWNGYKYTYPFTLGGVIVNNSLEVDTKIAQSGDFKGVVYRVKDGQSISEATDFFKHPVQASLEGLIPELNQTMTIIALCGVGCLALLTVLKVLPRVFSIFQI